MAGRNSALYKHSGPAEPRSELSSSSYSRNYNVQEISEPIPSARTFAPSSPNRASRTVEVTDLDRLLDNPSLSEQPPSLPPKAYKSTAPNMISASNPSPQRTIFQESSYPGSLGTFPASATNIQNSPIRLPTEPPSPSMAFPPSATNTQNAPTRPPTVSPPKVLPSSPPAPLSPIDGASRLADSGNSEGEVYLLKQKLQQLEFYKRRCNELSSQNAQLVEERQRLEELLNSSRRNEESAIEQQVQSLVQLDQFKCKALYNNNNYYYPYFLSFFINCLRNIANCVIDRHLCSGSRHGQEADRNAHAGSRSSAAVVRAAAAPRSAELVSGSSESERAAAGAGEQHSRAAGGARTHPRARGTARAHCQLAARKGAAGAPLAERRGRRPRRQVRTMEDSRCTEREGARSFCCSVDIWRHSAYIDRNIFIFSFSFAYFLKKGNYFSLFCDIN